VVLEPGLAALSSCSAEHFNLAVVGLGLGLGLGLAADHRPPCPRVLRGVLNLAVVGGAVELTCGQLVMSGLFGKGGKGKTPSSSKGKGLFGAPKEEEEEEEEESSEESSSEEESEESSSRATSGAVSPEFLSM
jgi:hypothetical protein